VVRRKRKEETAAKRPGDHLQGASKVGADQPPTKGVGQKEKGGGGNQGTTIYPSNGIVKRDARRKDSGDFVEGLLSVKRRAEKGKTGQKAFIAGHK